MTSPLFILPAITATLGVWQISRLKWKLEIISQAQKQQQLEPTRLEIPLDLEKSSEWSRRIITGYFEHEQEMLIGPRPRNDGVSRLDSGTVRNSGYLVLTPFVVCDEKVEGDIENKPKILVNRGWLPSSMRHNTERFNTVPSVFPLVINHNLFESFKSVFWRPKSPPLPIDKRIQIEGFIRRGEPSSFFQSSNIPSKSKYYSLALPELSFITNSLPLLIELDSDSEINASFKRDGFPIMRVPTAHFRNQHLEYAITWFGLTAAGIALLLKGRAGSKWRYH